MKTISYFVLLIPLTAIMLVACKADEVIVRETRTITKTDTLRQYSVLTDSVHLHDSIYLEKLILSDTIRETKYVYRYLYRDRQGKDSVRVVNHVDTIFIAQPDYSAIKLANQKAELAQTKATKWKLMFWALVTTILFAAAFFLYYKLTKK